MTIAYIQSNLVRRTLIVLITLFLPLIIPIQAIVALFQGGWDELKRRVWFETTQGGDGYWKAAYDCWKAPQKHTPDDDALPYE